MYPYLLPPLRHVAEVRLGPIQLLVGGHLPKCLCDDPVLQPNNKVSGLAP
jgi:hypothetical protein